MRLPRVTPTRREAVPATKHRATIQSASSSSTGRQHRAASTRQVTVNLSRPCFAAHQTVPPAATSTRKKARPGSRYGSSRAASRPTTSAAMTTGRPDPGASGQCLPNSGSMTGGGVTTVVGAGLGVVAWDMATSGECAARGGTASGRATWRSGGWSGRSTRSTAPVVPVGGSTKRTVPPCRVATQRAMARPRPVPPAAALLGSSASVPKRSKARSRSAGGTPGPSSAISRRQPVAVGARVDPDRPALGAVTHGVVEQVDDQLPEPGSVGPRGQPVGHVDGEADGPAGRHQLGHGLVEELRHVDLGESQRRHPGIHTRELEQVADQVGEAACLADRGLEVLLVGRDHAVGEVLQHGGQPGQRRTQLVGDRGDEGALLAVDGVELGGHLVEGARQLADLVGRLGPDPAAVVAPCHPAGRLGHLTQRRGHADSQQLGDAQRERHGDREGEQRGDARVVRDDADDHRHDHAGDHQQAQLDLDGADGGERRAHVLSSSA